MAYDLLIYRLLTELHTDQAWYSFLWLFRASNPIRKWFFITINSAATLVRLDHLACQVLTAGPGTQTACVAPPGPMKVSQQGGRWKLISDVPQPECVMEDSKLCVDCVLPQLTICSIWKRGWHTFPVSQILQLSSLANHIEFPYRLLWCIVYFWTQPAAARWSDWSYMKLIQHQDHCFLKCKSLWIGFSGTKRCPLMLQRPLQVAAS